MILNYILIITLITLFLIPGPSNALFAYTAYHKNILESFKYLPAEYLGYLYAISLCGLFVHIMSPYWPALIITLHILSLAYVLWLAIRLWQASDLHRHLIPKKNLSSAAMFYATLRNPKAVLLTVGILPQQMWQSPDNFIRTMLLLLLIMIPTAFFWMFFGRALISHGLMGLQAQKLYKISAIMLIICTFPMILSLIYFRA